MFYARFRLFSGQTFFLFFIRFQILRDLIPNSDQKRDTASFLLEVNQLNIADILNFIIV